jgi:hypothetical protein
MAAPTSLTFPTVAYNSIILNWTPGLGSTDTLIIRKQGSIPTSRTDGTQVYLDNGNAFIDTGLTDNTNYCYALYSTDNTKNPTEYNETPVTGCVATAIQAVIITKIVNGNYIIEKFTLPTNATDSASITWNRPSGVNEISYLIVGGGGGSNTQGGGGGGGTNYQASYQLTLSQYNVTVGGPSETAGKSSSFGSNTASGGYAASGDNGGKSGNNYSGGTGGMTIGDGGGGGAGGNGASGSGDNGGAGGVGLMFNITGESLYYGGGGGGGKRDTGANGSGGLGGGGAGCTGISVTPSYAHGVNGLGGGGGGGNYSPPRKGGSGVVIIRYIDPSLDISGVCGTANNKTYGMNASSFGSDTMCSVGTSNPAIVSFPAQGATVNWICNGQNEGVDANCSASRTEAFSQWGFEGTTTINGLAQAGDVLDTWSINNGTLSSPAPVVRGGTDCISGKCLEFDSTNYVQIPDSATLSAITTTLSVEYWVKRTFDSGGYHILKQDAFGGLKDMGGNTFIFWSYHGADDDLSFTTDKLPMNTWHHVVLTWTAGVKKVYIDGSLVAQKNNASTSPLSQSGSAPLLIGNSIGWHANNFRGMIDQVSIYNKVITVAQVGNDYYAGLDTLYSEGEIAAAEYMERRDVCLLDIY